MTPSSHDLRDFDAWASLSARLRGQGAEAIASTLQSLGLSEHWPRADAYWRAVLIEDIADGRHERPRRYHQLCQSAAGSARRQAEPAPSVAQPPASQSPWTGETPASAKPPMPTPQSQAPQAQVQAPQAPVQAPQAPVQAPQAQMQAPQARAQAPQARMQAQQAEPQAPQARLPPVRVPQAKAAGSPKKTQGFAVAPAAPSPDAGFRGRLMGNVNDPNDSPPSDAASAGNFVERLAPQGIAVQAPAAGQTSTSTVGGESVDAAKAASDALRWPIEKYADVCARVEREPHRQELIWAEHGVVGKYMVRVVKRWRKRFAEDPSLEAQWRALVDARLAD